MRRSIYLATLVVASASVAQAQVLLNETFDDGLASERFDIRTILPATPNAQADIDFAYNYSTYNYVSYASGTGTPLATPTVQPIPSAPGSSGTTIGLRMRVAPLDPPVTGGSTIMSLGVLPKAVNVSGDFKIEGYMWMNYNGNPGDQFSSMGGAGSTEYMTVGLRRSGDTLTGPFPVGTNSPGYAFTMTGEGGTTEDIRFHNTDVGDDGPAFFKRNGAWFAASRENRYDLTTGNLITVTSTATPPVTSLIPDTPHNHAHSYYREEVFRNEDGFEIEGAPAKKWVKFEVEQHGRIAAYVVNGKAIGVLFNSEAFNGTPQFGYFDRTNGFAPNTVDANNNVNNRQNQFMLYDNLKVTQMAAATANTIELTKNYAAFGTGGSYTADGAASVDFLEFGSAEAINLSGTGTLTMGQTLAAVQSIGGGTHTISKPVNVTSNAAFSVVGNAGVLEFTDVTFNPTRTVNKNGVGRLKLPKLRVKSLMIADGRVELTGAGPAAASKVNTLDFGYLTQSATTLTASQLDLGRTVLAVDWANRIAPANPELTNNPFTTLLTRFSTGFNNGAWNGGGIMSSAPELLDPSSIYTFRFEESNIVGFADGSTWGATGLAIDASTVLMGFTFKADTNLDQSIDFDDLLKLSQNYGAEGIPVVSSWVQGDSNMDGAVNFDDLLALSQVYGRTVGGAPVALMAGSFEADWALARSLVPEPTSLTLLGLAGFAMGRRRRD